MGALGISPRPPVGSVKLPNYFKVTADFTSGTWNTVASHEIATVTGGVHMVIIPECTGTLTDAADASRMQLGHATDTAALIASTVNATAGTVIEVGEFWLDTTPADVFVTNAQQKILDFIIGNGLDIGYEITAAALTGGSMDFHIWWESINATGAVVAGAGGTL